MELNEYQNKAMSTCMETCDNFSYMMLNLVGEVGEFASKVAKAIRKGVGGIPYSNSFFWIEDFSSPEAWSENHMANAERDKGLKKEAGDILWQLSGLCKVMGWSLEEVAQMNLDKLQARKNAGTIDGDGDGVTAEDGRR